MAYIATGDRDEALDVVQDAMFKLVQRYTGHAADEWPMLFHRIVQNRIQDWYRRNKLRNYWQRLTGQGGRQGDDSEEDFGELPGAPHLEPLAQLGNAHALKALDDAIRQLPLRQQQAFLLRLWEGLDVAQTAQAMGCSAGSVKTHYSRAVHALRDQLEDHWP